jgi:hypothetical protein
MNRLVTSASTKITLGEAGEVKHTLTLDSSFERNDVQALWTQRIMINVPSPGFIWFSRLCIGGFEVLRGELTDAWCFNANAVGSLVKIPKISREAKIIVEGGYTGLVPAPLSLSGEKGSGPLEYTLMISLFGPASTRDTTTEELKRLDLE